MEKIKFDNEDLKALVPLLGYNYQHSFSTIYEIYKKDIERYKECDKHSLSIYTEKEFKELGHKANEQSPYIVETYNIYSDKYEELKYYTDLNIKDEKRDVANRLNRITSRNLLDLLKSIFQENLIMVTLTKNKEFDKMLDKYNFNYKNIQIYTSGNATESAYKLLKVFIRNVFSTDDKIFLNLIFFGFLENYNVNLKTNDGYFETSPERLKKTFEYSRVVIEGLKNIYHSKQYKFIDTSIDQETSESISDERNFINELIFSDKKIDDLPKKLNELNIDLFNDLEDELNLLQTYKYWSCGDKEGYLKRLREIQDPSIRKLKNKMEGYNKDKVKKIIIDKQIELEANLNRKET